MSNALSSAYWSRLASLGSGSLPAMKAFLQGEQFFRRTAWDSSIAYYQRALAQEVTALVHGAETADRVIEARRKGWQSEYDGRRTRRTLGFASLGGATLDNEENYLIKKLFTALGAIQIENQARI